MKKRIVAAYAQWTRRASIVLNLSCQREPYSRRRVVLLVSR